MAASTLRRIALGLGAALLFLGGALLVGWWRVDGPGGEGIDVARGAARPLPLTEMDFDLVDQDGRAVGPETLIGAPAMVFFGFTHCPEVCPTTLSDISGWLDALGHKAEAIVPVFVSVDPARDTVDWVGEYVSFFHPAIQAWTGTGDGVARAAEGFRVRYEKVPVGGGDYTMNHTASVFLYDAEGRFAGTVDYHEPREFALPKVRRVIEDDAGGAT